MRAGSFTFCLAVVMFCMTGGMAMAEKSTQPQQSQDPLAGLPQNQIDMAKSALARQKSLEVDAPNKTSDMPETARHGIRERVRQEGVFIDRECTAQKGDVPECYCAAHIGFPVFGRRVYGGGAQRLNTNIWEWANEHIDTDLCPIQYTEQQKNEPELFRDKVKLAFFQRISVPVYNKDFVSIQYDTYSRNGTDAAPYEVKYGALVDVAQKRVLPLSSLVGTGQDALLGRYVGEQIKKTAPLVKAVTFKNGESDDVTSFYLAKEGVVLQLHASNLTGKQLGTLSITLPRSMISHSGIRQLLTSQETGAKG